MTGRAAPLVGASFVWTGRAVMLRVMTRILGLLAAAVLFLPGCIVGEIRDELKNANKQLTDVQTTLAKLDNTNEQLAATNAELTRTAELIASVQQGLGRIDTTNSSLGDVQQRLALLQSINVSLGRLDTHLASLRKTIGRIDSAIPFIDLGSDESDVTAEPVPLAAADPAAASDLPVEAPAAGTAPTAAAEPATAPPTDATTTATAQPAAAPPATAREPMLGAWISRYPDDSAALILLSDNRCIIATRTPPGNPVSVERTGTWKRDQRNIILTMDAHAAAPTQPTIPTTPAPATPGTPTPAPAPAAEPASRTLEIVMSTGRSVTVRLDGKLMVLVRP